ncbi:MAG: hypothetical protein QOJ13_3717 [Gaiellales bacterium]|nr:hypothetical protein [Gaiellales bacterium]
MRLRRLAALAMLSAVGALVIPGSTFGAKAQRPHILPDWRMVEPNLNGGHALPLQKGSKAKVQRALRQAQGVAARETAAVGDHKFWLALDDDRAEIYVKNYKLRGIGANIEVWVADDSDDTSTALNFPAGDCRNGPRTVITNAQVNSLIHEFDTNMLPKESAAFSVAPARNGAGAPLAEILGLPADYYVGDGKKTVVLIDNVRDSNFYDADNSQGNSYIAGFFYSLFNDYFNRNAMTIDGYDWLHRTGANPPDDPVPGNLCKSAPARPFLYEGVFAHEYQHLLEHYEDPDEQSWVNEGLSVWAETITGYNDPGLNVWELGFDSQVACFLGQLTKQTRANPNPSFGGPENSLTLWGDQGDDEILCDYGAARTIMEYVADHHGANFMRLLHRNDRNGLDSMNSLLASRGTNARTLLHRWAAMVALDRAIEQGAVLQGGNSALYSTDTLHAKIRWLTPHAYSTPGAPPNGSDYVRLRGAAGQHDYLSASGIDSVSFDGADLLPALPVEWTVAASPPGHSGNAALYSGSGPNFDRAIIRQVDVPAANPTLTFDTTWNTEEFWDYGYVQVSTNGGATWKGLANADTNATPDAGAIQLIKDNLPGLTGDSGGWKTESFDLSAYAGKQILLSFRYITDPGVDEPGWWVDNIKVGGALISNGSSLAGWQSQTQVRQVPVNGFTVQLIAYDRDRTSSWLGAVPLDGHFRGTVSGAALDRMIGNRIHTVVAAIVMYDEPTELIGQYAPYTLKVNGLKQPGGGM